MWKKINAFSLIFAVFSILTSPCFWCIAAHAEASLNDSQMKKKEKKSCLVISMVRKVKLSALHITEYIHLQVQSTIAQRELFTVCIFESSMFYNLPFLRGHTRVAETISLCLSYCEIIFGHHPNDISCDTTMQDGFQWERVGSLSLRSFRDSYQMCRDPVYTFAPAGHTVTRGFQQPAVWISPAWCQMNSQAKLRSAKGSAFLAWSTLKSYHPTWNGPLHRNLLQVLKGTLWGWKAAWKDVELAINQMSLSWLDPVRRLSGGGGGVR